MIEVEYYSKEGVLLGSAQKIRLLSSKTFEAEFTYEGEEHVTVQYYATYLILQQDGFTLRLRLVAGELKEQAKRLHYNDVLISLHTPAPFAYPKYRWLKPL